MSKQRIAGSIALALILASGTAEADGLRVFAAASLTDALGEVAQRFEAKEGVKVTLVFGASSELSRQILAGAGADVFFSADEARMDALQKAGQVSAEDRVALLGNQLVVIVPKDSPLSPVKTSAGLSAAFSRVRHLALADPSAVPAGVYAKAWLERQQQWDTVKARVVPTLDVRAALAAVETGASEVGIVYRTDVQPSRRVRVLYEVPLNEGPAIVYPVAPVASSKQLEQARRFLAFLQGDPAKAVFERHGFRFLLKAP